MKMILTGVIRSKLDGPNFGLRKNKSGQLLKMALKVTLDYTEFLTLFGEGARDVDNNGVTMVINYAYGVISGVYGLIITEDRLTVRL